MPYISQVDINLEDINFQIWVNKHEEYLKYIFKNFNEVFDVEDNKDSERYFYYLLFINSSKNTSKKRGLLIK